MFRTSNILGPSNEKCIKPLHRHPGAPGGNSQEQDRDRHGPCHPDPNQHPAPRRQEEGQPHTGVYKVQTVGEEYQVVKRGREYHACGEEYNVEKRERGSNIIFSIILRLLGRISRGEGGRKLWGKEIKDKRLGTGKNIKL